MSFDAFARMLEASAEDLQSPDFRLRLSSWQGLHILGPLAVIARHAQTVLSGVEAIARYLYIHSPALRLTERRTERGIEFAYEVTESPDPATTAGHRRRALPGRHRRGTPRPGGAIPHRTGLASPPDRRPARLHRAERAQPFVSTLVRKDTTAVPGERAGRRVLLGGELARRGNHVCHTNLWIAAVYSLPASERQQLSHAQDLSLKGGQIECPQPVETPVTVVTVGLAPTSCSMKIVAAAGQSLTASVSRRPRGRPQRRGDPLPFVFFRGSAGSAGHVLSEMRTGCSLFGSKSMNSVRASPIFVAAGATRP